MIDYFLSQLPKKQRVMFMCKYWYFCTTAEIAVDFQMTESNVKTTLFRIRNKLKIFLEKEGIDL